MNPETYELVFDIRLHDKDGKLFHCEDCGRHVFRQVTDILQGSMGYEVYQCRCGAEYRCQTIEVMQS